MNRTTQMTQPQPALRAPGENGASGRGALLIGYAVIAILAMVGIFLGTRSSFYTHCVRPEPGASVTCTIEQRWFGLVPYSVDTVTQVQSVADGRHKTTTTRAFRDAERRDYNHLTIVGASETIEMSHERDSVLGVSNADLADRIDAFLEDPAALQLSAWQVEWLPALASAGFLLIPALVLLSLLAKLLDFVKRLGTGQATS